MRTRKTKPLPPPASLNDWMYVAIGLFILAILFIILLTFIVPPQPHSRGYNPLPPTTQPTYPTTTHSTTTTTSGGSTTSATTTPAPLTPSILLECPPNATISLGAPYGITVTGNAIGIPINTNGTACQTLYVQCFDSVAGSGNPGQACALNDQRNNTGYRPYKRDNVLRKNMDSIISNATIYYGKRYTNEEEEELKKKRNVKEHFIKRQYQSNRNSKKRVRSVELSSRSITFGETNIVLDPNPLIIPYQNANPSDINSATNSATNQTITVYNYLGGGAKYTISDSLVLNSVLQSGLIGTLGGSSINCTGNAQGEPIVLWDTFARNQSVGGRWIVAEKGQALGSYCVHISKTEDALGAWTLYEFSIPTSLPLSYPKMGSWPQLYAFTSLNQTCVMDKIAMWTNNATASMLCSTQTAFEWTPVNVESSTVPLETEGFGFNLPGVVFMSLTDEELGSGELPSGRTDFINVQHWYTVNFTSPTVQYRTTTYQVEVLDYDLRGSPIPTPSGTINPVTGIIMNRLVYRNLTDLEQSVVGCFTSNSNGIQISRVRWFELRWYKLSPNSQAQFHVYQDAEIDSGDLLYKFLPTITIDGWGNIALGFTTCSASQYPTLALTMQLRNDPINQMRNYTIIPNQAAPPISINEEWGAYGSMSVIEPNYFYFSGQMISSSPGLWNGVTMLFNGKSEMYNRTFMSSYVECKDVVVNCTQFISALG